MKSIIDEINSIPPIDYNYPTNKEASEAFNTLMGWCMGMGMEEGNYTDQELCNELSKYISLLK